MTFLELAEKVLKEVQRPLSQEEIWRIAQEKGYANQVGSKGKTPWATIGARLYVDIRNNPNSKFTKTGQRPARFALKEFAGAETTFAEEPIISTRTTKHNYCERDLHAFLTYFAYTYRKIYTKTIYHQPSSKDRYAQWLHPDMVGVYFPLHKWEQEVLEIAREVGNLMVKLYSYKIKRELTFSNLREAFFQAVSNSSWAHQGYIVAAEIAHDEQFRDELERLSSSFGIGVIKLDINNPDDSVILIPAREKEFVDINTMNRLAAINPNFREFLRGIKNELTSREIRKEWSDRVLSAEALIQSMINVEKRHA
ncbi:HTH domain-containing protein [Thermosynechococcus sp. PP42]|uniref:COG2958 family protein n=1 Tax=Thermosynechococcus sp. PP42 TaxID=3074083 RepID=UPI0028575CED|nr:HTH domain-containing protein [Thermosynechococcus sp. PP42]MDR5638440.1 HTH domain-containing protein [Thermosynechococcus sp. PP42]